MPDTVNLIGNLVDIGQQPRASVLMRFWRNDLTAQYGSVVDPSADGVRTDGSGDFSVDLLPGNYTGEARLAGSKPRFTFGLSEDDIGGTVNLSDALEAEAGYITPDVALRAEDAADRAEDAANAVDSTGFWALTVPALIANTSFGYSTGTIVDEGDYIRIRRNGFSYEVAASGASDQDLTTAGGVKLYVTDTKSPVGFNAVGDGATLEQSKVQAYLAFEADDRLQYAGTFFTLASGGVLDLNLVDDGTNARLALRVPNGGENMKFTGRIESLDGTAFSDTATGAVGLFVNGAVIIGASYGWLSNESDTENVIVTGSYIYSNRADAVELNHPNGLGNGFIYSGVILETGDGSAFAGSGFGFGVAGTKNWLLGDAVIKHARETALHFEDEQTGIMGTVFVASAKEDGLVITNPSGSQPELSSGLSIANLYIKHTGSKTGFRGIYTAPNGDGETSARFACGTARMVGFDYGFDIQGGIAAQALIHQHMISNAIAEDCNVALNLSGGVGFEGTVLGHNCPTLLRLNNGAYCRNAITDKEVTTLIDYTGGATQIGAEVGRLKFPTTITHTGGGTEVISIMDFPTRFLGRVTLRLRNPTNFFFGCYDLTLSGTTVTIDKSIVSHIGALSGATIVNNAGVLAVSFASSAAITDATLEVDFEGSMYVTSDIVPY